MTPADIRATREALGLTQTEFARVMGVSGQTYVSAWETGSRKPSGPAIKLMRAYLDQLTACGLGGRRE